ncbi:MAG: S-layer homology domain-containing protein, partial [Deinococcota bacterium]|nr:S-layer homology domain-containing protein [Deinococcota bacterium]
MKKLFMTLLALLTATGAVAQDQPAFPDIPAGHWAADAVNRIADLGIVIGFPDGTFGGNEGFTRYQAALVISRLLNVIADDAAILGARVGAVEGDVGLLRGDVATLEGRLVAAEVTAEAALARAEAAEAAAAQVATDPELAAQIEANARGIANLNEVVALLEAEIRALQTAAPVEDGAALDVANIREFVILLRRDQVALRERVAALEEQVAGIAGLEERVTQLEQDILTLSGSATLTYTQGTVTDGLSFDVDRIFGLGQRRELSPSAFTTGARTGPARPAQERSDIFATPGAFATDLTVDFGFGTERALAGVGVGGLDAFDAVLELGLRRAFNLCSNAACTQTFNGYVFELRNVISTIDVAGAGPIQFQFGEAPEARFTPYVFQALGPG